MHEQVTVPALHHRKRPLGTVSAADRAGWFRNQARSALTQ